MVLLVFAFIFCLPANTAISGLLQDRISSASASGYFLRTISPAAVKLLQDFDKNSDKDKLPSFVDLLEVMLADQSIQAKDVDGIVVLFSLAQKPLISGKDLSALYKASWEQLDRLHLEYSISNVRRNTDLDVSEMLRSSPDLNNRIERFYRDGSKLRIDCTVIAAENGEEIAGGLEFRRAYDGDLLRFCSIDRSLAKNSAVSTTCNGEVHTLESKREFIPFGSPLRSAKLYPWAMQMGEADASDCLALWGRNLYVFESSVDIDGYPCVVVGTLRRQLYLSTEHNYAVRRVIFDMFEKGTSPGAPALRRSKTYSQLDNGDFIEAAPGLWLPKSSNYRQYVEGRVVAKYNTTVTECFSDPQFEPIFFEEIFDDPCVVTDALGDSSKTYKVTSPGDSMPLVGRSSYNNNRFLLIAINILVVCLLAIFIILKKRSAT